LAAEVRGAESNVDLEVDAVRQSQIPDSAARSHEERPAENPPQEGQHTATVIDLRTAEPIIEIDRLTDEAELGRDAAVVVNLILPGDEGQRAADRGYVDRMLGMMAEVGNGPMHMGRAVTLEGDARYESIAIVYYPGVHFFRDMLESRFYQGIVGGKQLGDNQSSITVPILERL